VNRSGEGWSQAWIQVYWEERQAGQPRRLLLWAWPEVPMSGIALAVRCACKREEKKEQEQAQPAGPETGEQRSAAFRLQNAGKPAAMVNSDALELQTVRQPEGCAPC